MRISELLLNESEMLDEISRPPLMDAISILNNAGYNQIGKGYFGYVFNKPDSDHVLKLFKSADKAYMEFVNLAMRNPNPHFPKFKGKMMGVNDEYYAIRMEKLTSVINYNGSGLSPLGIHTTLLTITDCIYINQSKIPNNESFEEDMQRLEKIQPGITKACELIAGGVNKHRMVDLHPGNVMMRGDVLVIIDPVAF